MRTTAFLGLKSHQSTAFLAATRMLVAAFILALTVGSFHAAAEDWPKYNHDLANTGLSGETGINSKNVAQLQTKWTFTASKMSATPAVATINGTPMVFIPSWDGIMHALNAVTGVQIWSFKVDAIGNSYCNDTYCRMGSSPAVDVAQNLVLFGSSNAYLYALNATTGALVWKVVTGDSNAGYEVWSSPAIYQGMVYIGVSSHGDNPCIVGGEVQAYDELTGDLDWSFNTIDQGTCPTGVPCVGGSVWSSVAIDEVNGIAYAGTGNPGSTCKPPTANAGLYPDSILAFNASTGQLLNYFQAIRNDMMDHDFGATPVLHMTGQTNECTGHSTTDYWITEGSKNANVYFAERGTAGLTGNVQQQTEQGDVTATAVIRPIEKVTSCGNKGKHIINYSNMIYVAAPSGLWVYNQSHKGAVTLVIEDTVSKQLRAAPAAIQDIVFFGGGDGNLYVSGGAGKIIATFPTDGSAIYGGIAISGNRVYFGTTLGTIYCMSVNGQ